MPQFLRIIFTVLFNFLCVFFVRCPFGLMSECWKRRGRVLGEEKDAKEVGEGGGEALYFW